MTATVALKERNISTVYYGEQSISYLAPRIWKLHSFFFISIVFFEPRLVMLMNFDISASNMLIIQFKVYKHTEAQIFWENNRENNRSIV